MTNSLTGLDLDLFASFPKLSIYIVFTGLQLSILKIISQGLPIDKMAIFSILATSILFLFPRGTNGKRVYAMQPLWGYDVLRKDSLWRRTFLGVEMCSLWRVY